MENQGEFEGKCRESVPAGRAELTGDVNGERDVRVEVLVELHANDCRRSGDRRSVRNSLFGQE